ncbi:MAG: hypothetical protein JO290_13815 [Sphingomonadaceae bacterium]|nr:hypothetical protein [Sphingomonadaceae bacterium]
MNRILVAAAVALMAGTAMPAAAAINARQIEQRSSIDAGVRSGRISGHEARILRQEQNLITRAKLRLKARNGGHLSAADKKKILDMQDAAARHIDRFKHNRVRGTKHVL